MFWTGLTCNHPVCYAQKTLDIGKVSSVAYLAERVPIDLSIVEASYEAKGIVGS